MKIIYDKITKEVLRNTGTNSLYPEGVPNEMLDLKENESVWSLHDINDKVVVDNILNAREYELVLENNIPIGVNILKTLEEYRAERIPSKQEINTQVVAKIREVYDINKEFEMQRRGLHDLNDAEYQEYLTYVNECVTWGQAEKEIYGIV